MKELQKKETADSGESEVQPELALETVSANSIEAAPVKWVKDYPAINSDKTLEEKMVGQNFDFQI